MVQDLHERKLKQQNVIQNEKLKQQDAFRQRLAKRERSRGALNRSMNTLHVRARSQAGFNLKGIGLTQDQGSQGSLNNLGANQIQVRGVKATDKDLSGQKLKQNRQTDLDLSAGFTAEFDADKITAQHEAQFAGALDKVQKLNRKSITKKEYTFAELLGDINFTED